ncbi:MAG: PilN domain-containing protein [Oscillospiraceae bacterium]|nr:PilN domain-containing protein [Oscillospiraceae bacterium]
MRKLRRKNIDLYDKLIHISDKSKGKKKSAKFKYLTAGAACVVVAAAAFTVSQLYLSKAQERYDEISVKANDPELQSVIAEDEMLVANNEALTIVVDKYSENRLAISESEKLSENMKDDMIKIILSCQTQNTRVTEISFDGTYFTITGIAQYVDMVSDYVSVLDSKDLFSAISYTGFTGAGDTYNFTISASF